MSKQQRNNIVNVGNVSIGPGRPLALIAGPCVIESHEHTIRMAEGIKALTDRLGMPLVFKASFDKANRSSLSSFRGPGLDAGLAILSDVHMTLGVPITSDIHEPEQAEPAAQVLDLLQIPAFLCRQTNLLIAAAKTGKAVNVKKGQFISPDEMRLAVEKVLESGTGGVLLTERGTFFGYGRLVNDMTAVMRMSAYAPVVFDATHSCQLPGHAGPDSNRSERLEAGLATGGLREMVPVLARAGVASGAHALFLEVHDHPSGARSDAATVWPLEQLAPLLESCLRIFEAVQAQTAAV